jgi:hypothetical protein
MQKKNLSAKERPYLAKKGKGNPVIQGKQEGHSKAGLKKETETKPHYEKHEHEANPHKKEAILEQEKTKKKIKIEEAPVV